MKPEQMELIRNKLQDSVCVLIAIGDGMKQSPDKALTGDLVFEAQKIKYAGQSKELRSWLANACLFHALEAKYPLAQKSVLDYDRLYEQIKFKNYFVVCNNTDGLIRYSAFNQSKVVMPCGTPWLLQCEDNCSDAVTEAADYLYKIYEKLEAGIEVTEADIPRCPHCGKRLRFNIRQEGDHAYCEAGYIKDWLSYRDWMQTTMNQNTVLLELGESFTAPMVVRWPFERIAYLNQKAFLVRVNSRFYQIGPELKQKALGIEADERSFLNLL